MSLKPIAIACDVETTGFDREGCDVLSMAFVEILEDYTLGREIQCFSKPYSTKYYSAKAQEKHKISYWKAMEFPEPKEGCLKVLNWLKPHMDLFPFQFINHANGKFDHKWIESHFRKQDLHWSIYKAFSEDNVVSTIRLARDHIMGLTNYKLETIAKHLGIPLIAHNALSDARACALTYCHIMKMKKAGSGELFEKNTYL